jgi:proline iminopeptidase
MRKKFLLLVLSTFLTLFYYCKSNYQENLLSYKLHTEDSIIYCVPQVARLCNDLNIQKNYVNIGDCKLYCEIEGEGIPIVLIHGGPGGTHHCFHPWLTGVSTDFQLIYYDQRGCGLSDFNAGEGYSFEQAVNDLEKLRIALKIDKWIVLGHSFGGGLAQFYTLKYPHSVIGQILVASVPMMNNPELNAINEYWFLNDLEKQKINEVVKLISSGKINYAQYFYNNEINGGWKRQNFIKQSKERMAQLALYDIVFDKEFNSDCELYHFEHAFDSCPIPSLICEGKYDSLWSAKKVELLRKNHPNAQFSYFEKSSHNIYSDEPDLLFKTIQCWTDTIKAVDSIKIKDWEISSYKILYEQLELINKGKLFFRLIKTEGINAAIMFYDSFKITNPDKPLFSESNLNKLAYEYLIRNDIDIALELFKLNAREYPQSWNVYDSLGEAYLKKGDKRKAKENYEKSVSLNPNNTNGKNILKEL